MIMIKSRLNKAVFASFLWLACVPVVFALDVGDPGFGGGDIRATITAVITALLGLMALIATVIIIISGIRMVVSQGEQEAVEKSKKTILYAVLGLILIAIAAAIVAFVKTAAGI